MAKHNEIGKIGESIAKSFLVKHGFSIATTNFRTKYGEIDIIANKKGIIHFVEVKSVKVFDFKKISMIAVRPQDNFTKDKENKCKLSAQIYLSSKNITEKYQLDLACIYICEEIREGRVEFFQNVTSDE